MASSETFTFVETTKDITKEGWDDYVDILSAKSADVDLQFSSRLRKEYPEMVVTTVPGGNLDLILFANLGYASYEIELENDNVSRWRGYVGADPKGGEGYLGEIIQYARYKYQFGEEFFILFCVKFGYTSMQYILKEPRNGETPNTHSSYTDKLLKAAGDVLYKHEPGIFVFDNYWYKDTDLYEEVQKASWDNVILDPGMKKDLTEVTEKFFDSKDVYDDLGVPWKRGLMFYGPPGNGKTISIKALMHTMAQRNPPIGTLYVKAAVATFYIKMVFEFARIMSPCLLILEDIETIVNPFTRSYFFNEVDGLANNDGIMMVASTNYLDRLDPGLTKRPSRFDRKYLFPFPNEHERLLYSEYWHDKLKPNKKIEFPKKLCAPMAVITEKFSFAYIQEAFVATLLDMARRRTDLLGAPSSMTTEDNDNDWEKYELWNAFKEQVKILRKDMDSTPDETQKTASSSIAASHALEPIKSSLPALRGAFHDGRATQTGINRERVSVRKRDEIDRDTRARDILSQFDKQIFRNRSADDFRPYDDYLVFAKRS